MIRSFPIASLTKEKKFNILAQVDHFIREGLQLRSCTFQVRPRGAAGCSFALRPQLRSVLLARPSGFLAMAGTIPWDEALAARPDVVWGWFS